MREFLEDAEAHRADSYRLAQKHVQMDLPKRFYKDAGVGVVEGGFTVTLDGRATRTPGRVPVLVPLAGLAAAMAEEWAAQGERLEPTKMPLIRLINSTIEGGNDSVQAVRDEISQFAANDLLLYRADTPESLVAAQEHHWDAVLVALARQFGVAFRPTIGITHQPQPDATLERIGGVIATLGLFEAVALHSITTLTGSGLLAVALHTGLIDADAVWTAAHVDEDFQISQWGEIEEARLRRERRRTEFDAAVRVVLMFREARGKPDIS